jgi:hypothetical protein
MSENKDPHRTDGIKNPPLVAQRLLLLQEMFEGTGRGASVRMAQGLRITPHHWYNVLRGSPLSIALAHRIVLTFPGVSLDWLYLGRPEGLSCQIAEKLGYEAAHSQPGVAEQKTSQEQRRSPAIPTIGPGGPPRASCACSKPEWRAARKLLLLVAPARLWPMPAVLCAPVAAG